MAHLKGQNVNLYIQEGSSYLPITASTACDFNVTANTEDGTAKDDEGDGMFDNPDFTNYSWNFSNESFVVSIAYLTKLLDKVINGDATFAVQYGFKTGPSEFCKFGKAVVTSLAIEAADSSYVKLSISMDGTDSIYNGGTLPTIPVNSLPKIRGKALMVAMKVGENWSTIACSKSHKLTINCNVSDITDKDYNDKSILKEVTGKSVTLSAENLIEMASSANGVSMASIYDMLTAGNTVEMQFGYYPNSIGQSIHEPGIDYPNGWGDPTSVLLEGKFLCTSLNNNGTNKQDATFSAEFKNKGKVTVSTPAAAATAEE